MATTMQEQKPGLSITSSVRTSSKKLQPTIIEMNGSENDNNYSNDRDENNNNNSGSLRGSKNNYGDAADDDASEESARHQSPPSRLRCGMDIVNQLRYRCGTIVNNENVQFSIVLLIAINAIMMGVGTFDFVTDNPQVYQAFETTDKVFLWIFTVELALQFIFHGWRLLLDAWLVFDLIVIVVSWSFSDVQIIRAFRIFRALRLITRIEVMKNLVLGKSWKEQVDGLQPVWIACLT
jgi:Ion transport protein